MNVEFDPKQLAEIKALMQKISTLKSHEIITSFQRACLVLENRVKVNISGDVLKTRSGRLRQSIGTMVSEKEGMLAGNIGSGQRTGKPVVYANILETGGVIRPVKRQWLTIPTEYAKARSGAGNIKALEIKQSFFARSKNGNLILFDGAHRTPIPMFVLKKRVKIPAKHYLTISVTQGQQEAYNQIVRGLSEVLK